MQIDHNLDNPAQQEPSTRTGEVCLWAAVIERALLDAQLFVNELGLYNFWDDEGMSEGEKWDRMRQMQRSADSHENVRVRIAQLRMWAQDKESEVGSLMYCCEAVAADPQGLWERISKGILGILQANISKTPKRDRSSLQRVLVRNKPWKEKTVSESDLIRLERVVILGDVPD